MIITYDHSKMSELAYSLTSGRSSGRSSSDAIAVPGADINKILRSVQVTSKGLLPERGCRLVVVVGPS